MVTVRMPAPLDGASAWLALALGVSGGQGVLCSGDRSALKQGVES